MEPLFYAAGFITVVPMAISFAVNFGVAFGAAVGRTLGFIAGNVAGGAALVAADAAGAIVALPMRLLLPAPPPRLMIKTE